jgi:hypothetical protein
MSTLALFQSTWAALHAAGRSPNADSRERNVERAAQMRAIRIQIEVLEESLGFPDLSAPDGDLDQPPFEPAGGNEQA